ncbi:MAG TPA: glycosyltransferase [Acidimicrobiia bacterium]|jgi:cellulose synthase/poly-beta-1,6-N-acetylglucosamine synthase-like glycosyltransferase|nr:glycosyltransferase [Acidimicrobiia bacterium]
MIREILRWLGYATIVYFIAMQTYLVLLALLSGAALRRNHHLRRFGRVGEMLSSRTTPPISIVIPAYNEEAGIVDAVRSMSIVKYPRFEIVVTNDGSKDATLESLVDAFHLEKVKIPYRPDLESMPVRAIYRGRSGVDITVIDKENGGRADALNAGINAARYPYVMCTDADVVLDPECLVNSMQRVVEDRERTVGVGGNVRPLNGSRVELGHLIEASVPRKLIPRMQILEYVRTFLSSRPGWSWMNALPNVSGAFGIWKRSVLVAVGGFTRGHLGEDMDVTMRIHRYHLERGLPYRIVYEPSAVIWTEVPDTVRVLRRQRIRWHRGLMTSIKDFMSLTFNPRYRQLGLISWGGFFLFEYLAPMIEFVGWFVVPTAWLLGILNTTSLFWMVLVAFGMGLMNSLLALLLDESYGYFNSAADTSRLVVMAVIENFGLRQMTVLWRIRAMIGGRGTQAWGNMERRGVANLAKQS